MLIRVIYQDDRYDMVKPFILDSLLSADRIKKFLRSNGWAAPSSDRTRGIGGLYDGEERRQIS